MQKGDAMDAAERSERIPDIVIITGMSGSGRTQAMHVFEDMGYFCIDNLPPRLIAQLAELVGINTGVGRHLAVTCDLRSQGLFDELLDAVAALEEREMSCDIVFLEASDEVLIRRYSENRRRHPIAKPGETTADAIQRERLQLQGVRDRADMIIDTSRLRTSPCATNCAWRSPSCPTSSSWTFTCSRLALSTACRRGGHYDRRPLPAQSVLRSRDAHHDRSR